ncbi:hypothetical protein ACFQH2_18045 [Natronoarchaeum sp. GCM10025703]
MTLATMARYEEARVQPIGDRAIVVGGSMAGLCAARILHDVVDKVVILERDDLPHGPESRGGAPQTSHPHAMLEAGRATLEDLFPGFSNDVLAAGGLELDMTRDIAWYDHGGVVAESATPLSALYASRPLFEHVVRERVRDTPGIRFREGCHFIDYQHDPASEPCHGRPVQRREGHGDGTRRDAHRRCDGSDESDAGVARATRLSVP